LDDLGLANHKRGKLLIARTPRTRVHISQVRVGPQMPSPGPLTPCLWRAVQAVADPGEPRRPAVERTKDDMAGAGFEPAKAEPMRLQRIPFDRSGTPPSDPECTYHAAIAATNGRPGSIS